MKLVKFTNILLFGLIFFISSCENSCKYPYQNSLLSPEERAEDLLDRLTLDEKVSLMLSESPEIERLGIKAYNWWNEALHGVARAGKATVYPQAIGMAASFDDELLYDVFTSISDEARAKSNENFIKNDGKALSQYHGLTIWTPNVNIFRDPRWGRGHETYGEDPYLTSRMGVSVVKGLQGPDSLKYDKLHACAKHYAVHSGPESSRHSFNVENIDPRDLWETYLPAFKNLVQKADVKEVMCAYNRFEGEPCCGSNRLLTQILRNEWGFDGIVVSDCWAINNFWKKQDHATHIDKPHAAASAVINGTDLECASVKDQNYSSLLEAVELGIIDEKRINISLKRILKARFELGEMDENTCWSKIPSNVICSEKHRALAEKMAKESIVLLQNNNNILPLKGYENIALIGPNANDSVMQWANYNGFPIHTVTLLEAVKEVVPKENFVYDLGCGLVDNFTFESVFNNCEFNGKKGFYATYWNNRNMEGEPCKMENIEIPFHFTTTGGTAFSSGVNVKDFSAKYETNIITNENNPIGFFFKIDGEIRLYINGKKVVEKKNIKDNQSVFTLNPIKGNKYNIVIEYISNEISNARSYLDFDYGNVVEIDIKKSVEKVKDSDIIIFAGGISRFLEDEGHDRQNIELPFVQKQLLKELKKEGKKIIFVNFSGSAVGLKSESEICDAIIQAWYPGQEGGKAISDVIFGKYCPSGRLPVTFYESTKQIPEFDNYSMKGRTYRYMKEKPLFCFGHGLSYTSFEYGNATVDKNIINDKEGITLTIPVTNIGKMDGDEIVQVYLSYDADKSGPSHTLRGFKRISINKGETVKVKINLSNEDFEWFDTNTNTMRVLNGKYNILYGGTSDIEKLKKVSIEINNCI